MKLRAWSSWSKNRRRASSISSPFWAGSGGPAICAGLLMVLSSISHGQSLTVASKPPKASYVCEHIPWRTTLPYAMSRLIALFVLIANAVFAAAQYTDRTAMNDLGGPKEFTARRAELAANLKTGYVLLFAKTQEPQAGHYREDNDFYYYTGLYDLGAVMFMDVEKQTVVIFEPQQSPREIQVYGANLLGVSKDEEKALGYPRVLPVSRLDPTLAFLFGS